MLSYFLYARKSTDDKEHQVHSIEDQVAVLRKLAREENLNIIEQFEERQTAKVPGRPVFNDMLKRIQKGEAQGIICWKLDRLARNMDDGGKIIEILKQSVLRHIRTFEKNYYPQDNVLLMCMEFGIADQYVRDLSSNTARGLLQKAKRGEFPGTAPFGYLNNSQTKLIVIDRKKAPVIRGAFELYAEGYSRLEDISKYLFENNVRSRYGNRLHLDRVKFILQNPFYYGYFFYKGELHEGRHTPIVEKSLFDKVQKVLEKRGHPQAETSDPQPLCGLLSCGECNMAITAEERVKRQKNGNVHRYVYYHCTKKRGHCSQTYVREEVLDTDLSEMLSRYVLPPLWVEDLERRMKDDEQDSEKITATAVHGLRLEIEDVNQKLARLTDVYIAQDIERSEYLNRRTALMSERKSVEERIAKLQRGGTPWLEPLHNWIKEASMLDKTAKTDDLPSKKRALQKIFEVF